METYRSHPSKESNNSMKKDQDEVKYKIGQLVYCPDSHYLFLVGSTENRAMYNYLSKLEDRYISKFEYISIILESDEKV